MRLHDESDATLNDNYLPDDGVEAGEKATLTNSRESSSSARARNKSKPSSTKTNILTHDLSSASESDDGMVTFKRKKIT